MLSNRHTDPTTVPSLRMCAEGNNAHIYSTCNVIITLKSWISGLSGNNWILTGL